MNEPVNLYQQKLATFKAYHAANPQVWQRFEAMALRMAASGRKHYSHDTIIAVLRWEYDLQTTGNPFKIANEAKAFYGRAFMKKHGSKYPGFFRLSRMRGEPLTGWTEKYHQES